MVQRVQCHVVSDALADRLFIVFRWWDSLKERGPATPLDMEIMAITIEALHGRAQSISYDLRKLDERIGVAKMAAQKDGTDPLLAHTIQAL